MKTKLWTIQDEKGWNELRSQKVLIGKEAYVYSYFKDGFDWMKIQMEKRIGNPSVANAYPIWAWYQAIDINKRKPDLRRSAHLPRGTIGYRIEIEKEEKDILLSDFELWHMPLSYKGFIANSEKELLEFESSLKRKYNTDSYSSLPDNIKRKIEKSWEKIFDMDFDVEYFASPFEQKQIQATFWELKLNEVIKVDEFIAR